MKKWTEWVLEKFSSKCDMKNCLTVLRREIFSAKYALKYVIFVFYWIIVHPAHPQLTLTLSCYFCVIVFKDSFLIFQIPMFCVMVPVAAVSAGTLNVLVFSHKPVNRPIIISNQVTPFLIEWSHLLHVNRNLRVNFIWSYCNLHIYYKLIMGFQ